MAFSRYINRPRLIFKYDADTVVFALIVAVIPILIGLVATYLIVGILVGGILGWLFMKYYPKYAKEKAPGLIQHFLYDIGLTNPNLKKDNVFETTIPPGYLNQFIE